MESGSGKDGKSRADDIEDGHEQEDEAILQFLQRVQQVQDDNAIAVASLASRPTGGDEETSKVDNKNYRYPSASQDLPKSRIEVAIAKGSDEKGTKSSIPSPPDLEETCTPGAYAVAPTSPTTSNPESQHESNGTDATTVCPDRTIEATASSSFLSLTEKGSAMGDGSAETNVIAIMVNEVINLPQAEPVDVELGRRPSNARTTSKHFASQACGMWLVLSACLSLGVAATVLAVLLPDGSKDSMNAAYNNASSSSPQFLDPLEKQLRDILQDDATSTLQDPYTPQFRALDWMRHDPNIQGYLQDLPRLRQRYALVSLYHSTGGEGWRYNDLWLSYDHHECTWWSEPDFAFYVPNFPVPTFPEYKGRPCDLNSTSYHHLWLWDNNLNGTIPEEITPFCQT